MTKYDPTFWEVNVASEILESILVTPDFVDQLLDEIAQPGLSAEKAAFKEAVMATKALCGYRVIHLSAFENDKPRQRYTTQNCELAAGRVFYWMKRDEFARLTAA